MKRAALWVAMGSMVAGVALAEQPVRLEATLETGTAAPARTETGTAAPSRIEMGTAQTMENPGVTAARIAAKAKAKEVEPYFDDSLDAAQAAVSAAYKAAKAKNGTLSKTSWVKSLAGKTDAESLYLLGACQWLGVGGPSKWPEAQKNFEAAAAAGSLAGKREHAKMLLRGQVDKGQAARGFAMMQALGDADADAMVERGILLVNGWAGVTADRAAGIKELEKAAAKGNSRAYLWLATQLTSQPQLDDAGWAQAAAWMKKAAEGGQVRAMRMYGMMLERGFGVTADTAGGTAYILKAANAGESDAQFIMSQKYRNAIGVDQDTAEALSWARACAQAGHPPCMESTVELLLEVQPDGADAMIKEGVTYVYRLNAIDPKAADALAGVMEEATTMPFSELTRMSGYGAK